MTNSEILAVAVVSVAAFFVGMWLGQMIVSSF